jgi:transposase
MKFTLLIVLLRSTSFVFVDESGLNRSYGRELARAPRGTNVRGVKSGRRFARTNVIAGLHGRKHVAVRCYNHSTTADFFEEWFEWELLSVVPEGSIIIMDNAAFHRKTKLHDIASRYGVAVLFLPPYSPEFNPIEKSWANLKHWLKDNILQFRSIDFAVEWYFGQCCS